MSHWPADARDTYLGMIYVCSSCAWRLTECKCPPDPPGLTINRYARGVDAGIYELVPIVGPPSAFLRLGDDGESQ